MRPAVVVVGRESIVGDNACTMCLYNVPRASLMITVPGLVIVVCGAAMTAFVDPEKSWLDGLAMVALVCLVLGGVWTVGGVVFWVVAWWRFKPSTKKISNIVSAGHDNEGVQLEAVTSNTCDVSTAAVNDHTYVQSTTPDEREIQSISKQLDECESISF